MGMDKKEDPICLASHAIRDYQECKAQREPVSPTQVMETQFVSSLLVERTPRDNFNGITRESDRILEGEEGFEKRKDMAQISNKK